MTRSVEVEAIQWDGKDSTHDKLAAWVGRNLYRGMNIRTRPSEHKEFVFLDRSGTVCTLQPSDWLIGEPDDRAFYTLTDEEFTRRFMPAESVGIQNPNDRETNIAFRKAWDARVEAGLRRAP